MSFATSTFNLSIPVWVTELSRNAAWEFRKNLVLFLSEKWKSLEIIHFCSEPCMSLNFTKNVFFKNE